VNEWLCGELTYHPHVLDPLPTLPDEFQMVNDTCDTPHSQILPAPIVPQRRPSNQLPTAPTHLAFKHIPLTALLP